MKYRRRIVYLSDPMWRKLALIAKETKSTISGTVRELITEPIEGEMLMWTVDQRDIHGKQVHYIDGDHSNTDPANLELQ